MYLHVKVLTICSKINKMHKDHSEVMLGCERKIDKWKKSIFFA